MKLDLNLIRSKLVLSKPLKKHDREAAVLIPLCLVKNTPSILFTVRAQSLREHASQVSFPGGNRDPDDMTLQDTALRETFEEIGIHASNVQLLGLMGPILNRGGSKMVTPIVGYLGSIEINKLILNQEEVAHAFTVPLEYLLDEKNKSMILFRESQLSIPSWDVSPFLKNIECDDRIWGLTAYFLNAFLKKIYRHYQ